MLYHPVDQKVKNLKINNIREKSLLTRNDVNTKMQFN